MRQKLASFHPNEEGRDSNWPKPLGESIPRLLEVFWFMKTVIETAKSKHFLPLGLLVLAWKARLFWLTAPGYVPDMGFFIPWMRTAAQHGISQVFTYSTNSYPPLSVYLLGLIGNIVSPDDVGTIVSPEELLFLRISIISFDILLIAWIYYVGSKINRSLAAIAALLYALSPGVIYLSGWWGQVDAWFVLPTVVAATWLARRRPVLAWIALGMAIAFKVQAVVILPVFLVGTWRWYGMKRLLISLLAFLTVLTAIAVPLLLSGQLTSLLTTTTQTAQDFPWITSQGHNMWFALVPQARARGLDINSDWNAFLWGVSYHDAGLMIFAIGYATLLSRLYFRSGPRIIYAASALAWLLFFMLPTRIHARFLFPVLALLLCAGFYRRRWWIVYGITAVTLTVNLVSRSLDVAPWSGQLVWSPIFDVANAYVNIFASIITVIWFVQPLWQTPERQTFAEGPLRLMNSPRERRLLNLVAILFLLGIVLILGRGSSIGQKMDAWAAPLQSSLEALLEKSETNQHTLIVNWPRAIMDDRAKLLGFLPITPPAVFPVIPEMISPSSDWVQYQPWQMDALWHVTYHGRFLDEDQLRLAISKANQVIAFNPQAPAMYTLLRQLPLSEDCPIAIGEHMCLLAANVTRAGETISIQLVWQANKAIDSNLTAFVHVIDESGALVTQLDGDPAYGLAPFSMLAKSNRAFAEKRLISLVPANHTVFVGMYHRLTGERSSIRCVQRSLCTSDSVMITLRP